MGFLFDRHFTLAEAKALLPTVREVFAHVHALVLSPKSEVAPTKKHSGNGHSNGTGHEKEKVATAGDYGSLTNEQRSKAATALLAGLEQKGIVIQDFTRGLIDFPSLLEGREVFLCYELADGDGIHFFHELDAGYAGRTPLDEMTDEEQI
ncbi:MAG: DUF2203 domain-containing protein [Candidatus Sumerlaeaceae bacterium]